MIVVIIFTFHEIIGGMKLRTDYYINPLASSVPQKIKGYKIGAIRLKPLIKYFIPIKKQ